MRAVAIVLITACGTKADPPREVTAAHLEHGRTIAGSLKKALFTELSAAIGRGMPSAIEVCQTRAPAIAAELARDGVRLGRATRRARNPQNLADGWKLDALAHFEEQHARKQSMDSFSRVLADGRIAYASRS
jgi:hypothetical protein